MSESFVAPVGRTDPTDARIRRVVEGLLASLAGPGLYWNGQGKLSALLDPKGPQKFNHLGQIETLVGEGQEVSAGSPRKIRSKTDDSLLFDDAGRMGARPTTNQVRNTSRVPGRSLQDALGAVQDRFNGPDAAGAAFPVTVWDGRTFYRTDLGEQFFYSGARSAWLSVRTFVWSGTTGALPLGAAYMSVLGDSIGTATFGVKVPYNMIVTEVTMAKNDAVNDPAFEVRADGSAVYSVQLGAAVRTGNAGGLNVAVSAGQVLNFYLNGIVLLGGYMEAVCRRVAA